MRFALTFDCLGHELAATLDAADGTAGLLIVSGGNEIRSGAHRGMAMLAATVAEAGYPVFRFDRRGTGDSEGDNDGFQSSGPDIAAALAAFQRAQQQLSRLVAFGNCDAATALVLHGIPVDALVLANPWVIEPGDGLPPPAAIRDRYVRRLRDPKAWAALLTGKINIGGLARGLGRLARPANASPLAVRMAQAMTANPIPTTILLSSRDNTALAFASAWAGDAFSAARRTVRVITFDSISHSFASDDDMALLTESLLEALPGRRFDP